MDSISLEELIMAVRRQSQGFSRGTSSFRGVTHHPSGSARTQPSHSFGDPLWSWQCMPELALDPLPSPFCGVSSTTLLLSPYSIGQARDCRGNYQSSFWTISSPVPSLC